MYDSVELRGRIQTKVQALIEMPETPTSLFGNWKSQLREISDNAYEQQVSVDDMKNLSDFHKLDQEHGKQVKMLESALETEITILQQTEQFKQQQQNLKLRNFEFQKQYESSEILPISSAELNGISAPHNYLRKLSKSTKTLDSRSFNSGFGCTSPVLSVKDRIHKFNLALENDRKWKSVVQ
jgi:GTPase Era involved in 16S rRNA processing